MKFKTVIAALLAAALSYGQALAAATLLPNGMQCFQAQTGLNGMIGTTGTLVGGSGYVNGTYGGVPLTGGSGSGATANITVSGNVVSAITVLNPGVMFVVGDVLSAAAASIGGSGSGFSIPIASTSINSSLAGGSVAFYYPNTSNFKSTWFNADQAATHQNTNPVGLDQNGCAVIYGTGLYRQVVKDSLGNTVWDQPTADVSANNSTFWAGISGGTPNAITVVDPGFNGTDGSIINFTALSTNTGSATLNPSSYGAISILKDTTGGPTSLIGGEIVQTNPISVIYRASDSAFHLLNTVIPSASGATAPLCGAVGLRITNNAGTPVSKIDLTAIQAVVLTPTGNVINRNSVSVTINMTVNGANGLDTGAVALNTIYNVWLIDNGAASAGLASLSSTAPTMPSGYTYKCRLGTAVTKGANTQLQTFLQLGNVFQYIGGVQPTLALGPVGANCGTAAPTYVATLYTATGNIMAPTAIVANLLMDNAYNGASGTNMLAAPNGSYTGLNGAGPIPLALRSTSSVGMFNSWLIEGTSFYFCADGGGGFLGLVGWRDSVNAN